MVRQIEIILPSFKKGIHLISHYIEEELGPLPSAGIVNIHLKHTSAALSLNENADPSVRNDLADFMDLLVPEKLSSYTHTSEGSDDMPAHIKASLFGSSLTIPVSNGKLNLGIWQGIYLCEFRYHGGPRSLVITIIS